MLLPLHLGRGTYTLTINQLVTRLAVIEMAASLVTIRPWAYWPI